MFSAIDSQALPIGCCMPQVLGVPFCSSRFRLIHINNSPTLLNFVLDLLHICQGVACQDSFASTGYRVVSKTRILIWKPVLILVLNRLQNLLRSHQVPSTFGIKA